MSSTRLMSMPVLHVFSMQSVAKKGSVYRRLYDDAVSVLRLMIAVPETVMPM